MKIRSVGGYSPKAQLTLVFVDPELHLPELPETIHHCSIISSTEELSSVCVVERLVIVEREPAEVRKILDSAIPRTNNNEQLDTIEYWCRKEEVSFIPKLVEELDEVSIDGILASENWIQLNLAKCEPTDRDALDLIKGIDIAFKKNEPNVIIRQTAKANYNSRTAIILRLLPVAKRIKPFLPKQMVVLLYKILRKIR